MKIHILLLLLFCLTLSNCTQSGPTAENSQSDNMNTIDTERTVTNNTNTIDKTITNKSINVTDSSINVADPLDATNLKGNNFFIPFENIENYQLKDFPDNKSLNSIENEMIKKNVINILLYIYNYDLDINTIEMDEDESKEWFKERLSSAYYYEVGWGILQELDRFARGHEDHIIAGIDADFMIHPKSLLENDLLSIGVVVYRNDIYGNSSLMMTYSLVFKRIDGTYKLIGITAEA